MLFNDLTCHFHSYSKVEFWVDLVAYYMHLTYHHLWWCKIALENHTYVIEFGGDWSPPLENKTKFVAISCHSKHFGVTSKNWPKCNHSIWNYMQLLDIYNYIWTILQLLLMLVIFVTTLQLVCNYFSVHPSTCTTFSLVFIQQEQFMSK
jgi:hypothetical protein